MACLRSNTDEYNLQLTIIIVSYNTRTLIAECLSSVYSETKNTTFEVVVVDNNSTDGSAQHIKENFPFVKLFALKENLGFARANNFAADFSTSEYILLLNPDTLIINGAIDNLVAFAEENPDAGIWGGKTLFNDGKLNPTSCWRKPTLWSIFCRSCGLTSAFPSVGIFNYEGYGGWQRNCTRRVDIVTGCFFLISLDHWKQLNGFDPLFFMYGEEADLCLRARKQLGLCPIIYPGAVIIHYGAASYGEAQGEIAEKRLGNLLAARANLIRRHLPSWQRNLALFLFSLWPYFRLVRLRVRRFGHSREEVSVWKNVCKKKSVWINGHFVK